MSVKGKGFEVLRNGRRQRRTVLKDSIENVLKCNKYIKTEEQAIKLPLGRNK